MSYNQFASTYFLKLSRIACHPPLCISIELVLSASNVSTTSVVSPAGVKCTVTFRPSPRVYSISSFSFTSSYTPPKSDPKLPSLASILERNLPPTLKSFSDRGVCQSSEALFHFMMCSGAVQNFQTFSVGALIVAFTVMVVLVAVSIFCFLIMNDKAANILRVWESKVCQSGKMRGVLRR